jgi:hypothetical protein
MAVLYEDCHKYLLSKRGKPVRDLLTEQRKIHEDLVEFLPIGAIPPDYDLTRAINAAKAIMLADEARVSAEQLGSDNKALSQSKKLDEWLQNPFGKTGDGKGFTLEQYLHRKENWIARFYVNAHGDYISANLRRPWEKEFGKIQPLPYMGICRLLEPSDTTPAAFKGCPGDLLCFEGEVNAEQFASECIRVADETSKDKEIYLDKFIPNACALGGVNAWDLETLSRVTSAPVICYDNDDGKGIKGLERGLCFSLKERRENEASWVYHTDEGCR